MSPLPYTATVIHLVGDGWPEPAPVVFEVTVTERDGTVHWHHATGGTSVDHWSAALDKHGPDCKVSVRRVPCATPCMEARAA